MPAKRSKGDGNPLDICVLSERPIARNEILVRARVLGGFQMVDSGDADDIRRYFETYKLVPGT